MGDGLSRAEIDAFASTFSRRESARAVLITAGFPLEWHPWESPNSMEFWSVVSTELSNGILIGGRARLLAAARQWDPDQPRSASAAADGSGMSGQGLDGPAAALALGPVAWEVPRTAGRLVGREAAAARLDAAVAAAPMTTVTGIAGIGKTRLVADYAHRHRADLDVVWWADAGRGELIGDRVRELAPRLDLPSRAEPAAVLAQLDRTGCRWLLILEDAADPAELPDWLRPADAGRILVTSRNPDWDQAGEVVALDPLERTESVALLADRVPTVDRSGAALIAQRLGDHPLALEQAARRMGQDRLPADLYLAVLRDTPERVLGEGDVPGRPGVTVATLWDEPIRRVAADHPAASELLRVAAHADDTPLPLRVIDSDPLELAGSVAALERAGLAHRDGPGLALHTLVRTAVRADTAPGEADRYVDTLGRLLHAALPENIAGNPAAWPAWRELLPHTLATLEATEPSADTPRTAWLAEHTAAYLAEQGHPDRAVPLATRAAAAHERLDGPDHPDTLTARETHIRVALEAGRVDEAGPLAARNATDRERVLGPDHPDTLTSRDSLARAYQQAGQLDHAGARFQANLADRVRVLGDEHPATLESRHRLGAVLDDVGRSDDATRILRSTMTARDRILGADHPDTLRGRHDLALAYRKIGATGDAAPLFDQTLTARERVLGPNHPDTLNTRHQLGMTYHQADRADEAARELDEALTGREHVLGPDHPRTLDSANALARAHLDARRPEAAVALFDRALAGRERDLGPDHSETTESRRGLGTAYLASGRPDDATPHYERVLDRHERVLGAAHPSTLAARDEIANIYRNAGRPESARHHLERQVSERARTHGVADARTLRAVDQLAEVHGQTGRLPQAVDLRERAHAIREQTLGPRHPDTRVGRDALAGTYRQAGRAADAVPLYRQALNDAMREEGPMHPDTIRARRTVADSAEQARGERPADLERPAPPERTPPAEPGRLRPGP
ncbi:tetratricopeptide repeat protein [Frankia sp. AgKG'84/4]